MNAAAPVLPVVAMLILSAFVRAVLGFGNALIAMPLLALIVSVQVATPLVALVNATTSVVILLRSWRSIDVKASWRLILAPEFVLDYVVAHEVAHLMHRDHGPAFWALTDTLTARVSEAKAWLNAHGQSLHRFG